MPFVPGNTLGKGRPVGTKNKRTQQFLDVLEKHNFDVAESFIWCFNEAVEQYRIDREKENSGRISPIESNAAKYLKIASDNVREIASHSCPKLKAIEVQNNSQFTNMSIDQQIIATKQLLIHLETKQKNGSTD